MSKHQIQTRHAPEAIGPYSQAIADNGLLYLSGQIPLDPQTMKLIDGSIEQEIKQVFENLKAVCQAAGITLDHIIKLNVYITDFAHYDCLNHVAAQYFSQPYPARAVVQVTALPKGARVEIEGIAKL